MKQMIRTAQNNTTFEAEDPITCLSAPHLSSEEAAKLLVCVNKVRSGERVYYVRVTNHKVTNTPKRVAMEDYVPDPALKPHAHEGFLVAAKINKKGRLFLRICDEARAPEGEEFGFTSITMDGIESFKVLGERPGPLSRPETAPSPQADLQALLAIQAQAMFVLGQSLIQVSTTMMNQLQQVQQPQQPASPARTT